MISLKEKVGYLAEKFKSVSSDIFDVKQKQEEFKTSLDETKSNVDSVDKKLTAHIKDFKEKF